MEKKEKHELNLRTRVFILPDGENKTKKLEVETADLEYIFKGMRPRLMDYLDYKYIRALLKIELKTYLKGEMVHLSKVSDEVWAKYTKDMKYRQIQKGHTYVREK